MERRVFLEKTCVRRGEELKSTSFFPFDLVFSKVHSRGKDKTVERGIKSKQRMKITLRKDHDPDIDFYYHTRFKIYHEPYLIWDRDT